MSREKLLGSSRHMGEDNIKIGLREIGNEDAG
jgi:hypothetical protein